MLMMSFSARSVPIDNLDTFSWSNRVILVFSEETESQTFAEKLGKALADIEERHIIWFVISQKNLKTNYTGIIDPKLQSNLTRQWFNQGKSRPQVVLIGKDGGEKIRSNNLDLLKFFYVIDQMPMRQIEMRKATGE